MLILSFIPLSVLFGEDVAFGGVFRCSVELKDRYGQFTNSVILYVILNLCLQYYILTTYLTHMQPTYIVGLVFGCETPFSIKISVKIVQIKVAKPPTSN